MTYKIATLLYCFSQHDDILLLERAQEPNLGLWSPCGGKLHTDIELLRSETNHMYHDLVERITDGETRLLKAFYSFGQSNS